MKTYRFADIKVMGMPTMSDIRNPYIFTQGIRHIINVCEHEYPDDIAEAIAAKGIQAYHFPVSEDAGADWNDSLGKVVSLLTELNARGEGAIVHCTCGNNRSRSMVEAFHLAITGEHLEDEYKGFRNHYLYNVSIGHIRP